MNTNKKTANMDIRERISVLWIVVMINMVFADICSFMLPENLNDIMTGNTPFEITQEIMLVFAIMLEIPIAMIFLSRVLKYRANRWANIIASVITISFVIGGGSASLHYYFFAAIEVAIMLLIIRYAWKWTDSDIK
jgi:Sec-independent protein secretion pathway component TatC